MKSQSTLDYVRLGLVVAKLYNVPKERLYLPKLLELSEFRQLAGEVGDEVLVGRFKGMDNDPLYGIVVSELIFAYAQSASKGYH